MIEPNDMACAVCGQVVDRVGRVSTGEVLGYRHTLASVDDHVVVPVRNDEVRTNFRCDFCTVDGARWVLPVEAYTFELPPDYDGPIQNSCEDWAVCDGCAQALRANDWNKIIYRAKRAFDRKYGVRSSRQPYVAMYAELRPHITGPVRLNTKEDA